MTLAGELAGARQAFDAAGVEAEVPGTIDEVPDDLRELFAWALREGTTNVLRHAAATRVHVTMTGRHPHGRRRRRRSGRRRAVAGNGLAG